MGSFKFAAVLTAIATFVGCGGTTIPPVGENEPAPSFWTEGDFRYQISYSLTFSKNYEDTIADIDSLGIENVQPANKNTRFYDALNRFQKLELVVFPQSPESSVPAEGRKALEIEYFYDAAKENILDTATLKSWDSWYDAGTGRLTQTILWDDQDHVFDVPTRGTELITRFDPNLDTPTPLMVIQSSGVNLFNDQRLNVGGKHDRDQNLANGYEDTDTWTRDTDGRVMTIFTGASKATTAYSYDDFGALSVVTVYGPNNSSTVTRFKRLHYVTVAGKKAVVTEAQINPFTVTERYETTVAFVADQPCHATAVNRLRFDPPDTESCYDVGNWR
jgi:hypothetical protein